MNLPDKLPGFFLICSVLKIIKKEVLSKIKICLAQYLIYNSGQKLMSREEC